MHYVYILYSEKLNRHYIGSTKDLDGRIRRHLSANHGFTANARDWILVYQEEFSCKSLALAREKTIKGWKSKDRIVQLISGGSEHPARQDGTVTGSNPVTPTKKRAFSN
jgi:putative endonuclease